MGFCHERQLDHPLEKINRISSEGSAEADDKKKEEGIDLPRKMEKSVSMDLGNEGAGLGVFSPRTRRRDCSRRAIQPSVQRQTRIGVQSLGGSEWL